MAVSALLTVLSSTVKIPKTQRRGTGSRTALTNRDETVTATDVDPVAAFILGGGKGNTTHMEDVGFRAKKSTSYPIFCSAIAIICL